MREGRGRRAEGNLHEWIECRFADLNGWESGREVIEKHENRFADIEREVGGIATGKERKPLRGRECAWSADGERQLGQLGTTFSMCAAQPSGGNKGKSNLKSHLNIRIFHIDSIERTWFTHGKSDNLAR